ncbi:hypothetical protein D9619_001684 [Psilocybe cf. subviscida]|uniref:Uncharacterized protein n=1 Tax=Psilocybe cf. subviscida TaxID=2480587 RepID=A0A8H5F267_9AGAR|nr:hypothetical protein D9619_001684 [Psilocybe cf. subviscida]
MQFKLFTAIALVCMTTLVSAAPVAVAPAAVEVARDITAEVAREAAPEPAPEPACSRFQCW